MRENKKADKRRELASKVRNWSVQAFYQLMKEKNVYRVFITYENGVLTLSHPSLLQPFQAFLELSQDFANHEGIFIGREDGLDSLFFAFVHDTRRGLSQGGLRFTHYENMADVLIDGLRLSQGMTRKNALAGLWWGGGKGIMTLPAKYSHPKEFQQGSERKKYFEAYGRFVASLGGIYYTAEDVGTTTVDMESLLSQNRFTTCIPQSFGGSGNPSPYTARGVLRAMQAAWQVLKGTDNLEGVKVAVQGAGNVGSYLIRYLYDRGAKIWICDVNQTTLATLKNECPLLEIVGIDEIYDLDVDIFAPCARGAAINSETIPRLKAKLVCGAANNILKEPESDAQRLKERDIAFVPDFLCNRMGIINCADEWQGYMAEDIRLAAERVYPDTLRVFKHAKSSFYTTTQAANELADIAASEIHPLIGHRGRRLIDHLIETQWHKFNPHQLNNSPLIPKKMNFLPVLYEPQVRMNWRREQLAHQQAHTTLAATPISAATSPSLASFLSTFLLDVRARAMETLTGEHPRRIIGSEHGGLNLQISIERSSPYEREEIGRTKFVELCQDMHSSYDAQIREQLDLMGIRFDPSQWLDTMNETGRPVVDKLYQYMTSAHLVKREKRLSHYCPRCQTALVASGVKRSKVSVDKHYLLPFYTVKGELVETGAFFAEILLGAVALAVDPDGKYAHLAGEFLKNPILDNELPIISAPVPYGDAEFVVPFVSQSDDLLARQHGINQRWQVFDENGLLCLGDYKNQTREQARELIFEKLNPGVREEIGHWKREILRCVRCDALVIPRYTEQLFLSVEEAVQQIRRAIIDKEIQFYPQTWNQKVLDYLSGVENWCISRQFWWGNQIVSSRDDVFSTWFSLAAWTLQGAGWPSNPKPQSIDEVIVDAEFLYRWIITSQFAWFLTTGRPAFKKIFVHGTLNVIERRLYEREGIDSTMSDEERFVYQTIRKPMRKSFGNVIEPKTLVRRFGADSVRLGLLLCMDAISPEVVTLSESLLRQARNTLNRLISKITGIISLAQSQTTKNESFDLIDEWILSSIKLDKEIIYEYYRYNQLPEVGLKLSETTQRISQYTKIVAGKIKNSQDSGAVRSTILAVIKELKALYSPVCPHLFEKLNSWAIRRCPDPEEFEVNHWVVELVTSLNQYKNHIVQIHSEDPDWFELFKSHQQDLIALTGAKIELNSEKTKGVTIHLEKCSLVIPE